VNEKSIDKKVNFKKEVNKFKKDNMPQYDNFKKEFVKINDLNKISDFSEYEEELKYEKFCTVKIPADKTSLEELEKKIEMIKKLMFKKRQPTNCLLDEHIIEKVDAEGNTYYEYSAYMPDDMTKDEAEKAVLQNVTLLTLGLGNVVAELNECNVVIEDTFETPAAEITKSKSHEKPSLGAAPAAMGMALKNEDKKLTLEIDMDR